MEQEETKTTAAAGVEMPPEAESWVQLHESELTELMQKQAKAAITELKRQEKQERNCCHIWLKLSPTHFMLPLYLFCFPM